MDSCRTLNSHFSDGSGQEVCQVWYLLFCSLTAYKALYRRSREARWISAMLRNVGDRFGLELARNLTCRFPVKWKVEGPSEARWPPAIIRPITESSLALRPSRRVTFALIGRRRELNSMEALDIAWGTYVMHLKSWEPLPAMNPSPLNEALQLKPNSLHR